MPFYTIRVKGSGVETEIFYRSYSELEEDLKNNPGIEVLPSLPNFVDSVKMGMKKTPETWREMLKDMKKKFPGSTINTDI